MEVLPVYVLQLLLAGSCCSAHDDVRIVPSRLQLFQYDSLVLVCDGSGPSDRWTVKRRVDGVETLCEMDGDGPAGRCQINQAFTFDSGEYWCDAKGGGRSDAVSISVTDGDVILDSPVVPVTAGQIVTLGCRTRTTVSDVTAGFSRNGSRFMTGSRGIVRIHNVSVRDGGRYKCDVADLGESPESWLLVREERRSARRPPSWWLVGPGGALLMLTAAAAAGVSSKRRRLRRPAAETPTESNLAVAAPPSCDHLYEDAAGFGVYSLVQFVESENAAAV